MVGLLDTAARRRLEEGAQRVGDPGGVRADVGARPLFGGEGVPGGDRLEERRGRDLLGGQLRASERVEAGERGPRRRGSEEGIVGRGERREGRNRQVELGEERSGVDGAQAIARAAFAERGQYVGGGDRVGRVGSIEGVAEIERVQRWEAPRRRVFVAPRAAGGADEAERSQHEEERRAESDGGSAHAEGVARWAASVEGSFREASVEGRGNAEAARLTRGARSRRSIAPSMTSPSTFPPAWEDPRKVLARHGLRPKKSFSQNFLVSAHAVEKIAAAVLAPGGVESNASREVLELGPGVGTLTGELLRRGARVVALEKDREMIALLGTEFAGVASLRVIEGDAASVSLDQLGLPLPLTVCGNLPYAVTGAVFRQVVDQREHVARAVFMIQREVRDRLLAEPGTKAYGALTVFVQAEFAVSKVVEVPPGAFHPPPKVHSSVIRLERLGQPRALSDATFTEVVRLAFAQRRKTLRNTLAPLGEPGRRALADVGIDPGLRGERLSVEEFAALAAALRASASSG